MGSTKKRRVRAMLCLALFSCFGAVMAGPESSSDKPILDRSGSAKQGKASYYSAKFYGKKMADGSLMNPESNVAASRTLPLGTKARVTNLQNGKSVEVEIRDRGPFVKGRIMDLSPKAAERLDFRKQGIALVEVQPIDIPQDASRSRRKTEGAVLASKDGTP